MTLCEIEQFASETLTDHAAMYPQLEGWSFSWNNRKAALGVCNHRRRQIELSRPLMSAVTSHDIFINTILHEIAHALAGPFAKHGPQWKRWAITVGARPVRCATKGAIDRSKVQYKYTHHCPTCGKTSGHSRKWKYAYACVDCCTNGFDFRHRLVETQNY